MCELFFFFWLGWHTGVTGLCVCVCVGASQAGGDWHQELLFNRDQADRGEIHWDPGVHREGTDLYVVITWRPSLCSTRVVVKCWKYTNRCTWLITYSKCALTYQWRRSSSVHKVAIQATEHSNSFCSHSSRHTRCPWRNVCCFNLLIDYSSDTVVNAQRGKKRSVVWSVHSLTRMKHFWEHKFYYSGMLEDVV